MSEFSLEFRRACTQILCLRACTVAESLLNTCTAHEGGIPRDVGRGVRCCAHAFESVRPGYLKASYRSFLLF